MIGSVKQLITYPVKGLSGQNLDHVTLQKARGFPMDRAFAFARHDSGMDAANPRPMPKSKFLVLARDAALARLDTQFDARDMMLTIRDGQTEFMFDCKTDDGIKQAADYLAAIVGLAPEKAPHFINGGDLRFTDVCMTSARYMHCISIINLASVRTFSKTIGQDVDPHRFRGNVLIDGLEAFCEFDLIDKEITIGDARLKILKRTQRCPATKVNLQTAQRDLDVPDLLDQTYGHRDMGVYAEVIEGGNIKPDDAVRI